MHLKKVGKKQFKTYAILAGMTISDMTKEQLEAHVYQLQQELDKEKEERNFFQIERDKIQLFWEVTKNQLEEKDAVIQLKDREIDEAELSHIAEIKLYKQKMKHVMFECQQHISEKLKEKMGEKLNIEEEHKVKVDQLENEINKLKDCIFQLKIDHENAIMEQRLKHADELCALHEKYQQEIDLFKSKEVEEIGNIRSQLDLMQNKSIQEIEALKDTHTQHLIQAHEELVLKMKNYYNNIIKNNVLLIKSIKDKMQNSLRIQCHLRETINSLHMENKILSDQLINLQRILDKRKLTLNENKHLASDSVIRNLQRELKKIKEENYFLITQFQEIKTSVEKINCKKCEKAENFKK